MALEYIKNDVIAKGFVTANQLLSSNVDLHDIFVTENEHSTSINNLSGYYLSLSGGEITGNLTLTEPGNVFSSGSVFGETFNSHGPSLIAFDTATIVANQETYLPINANDIELTTTSTTTTTITAFIGGIKGVYYVLTNKSEQNIYLLRSEKINIRTYPSSLTTLLTPEEQNSFILQPNHSCSLRADEDDLVSIW